MKPEHIYIRYEDYHETKAITIKNKDGGLYFAYPKENFNKNEDLFQLLLNKLHDLSFNGILHFEFKEVE